MAWRLVVVSGDCRNIVSICREAPLWWHVHAGYARVLYSCVPVRVGVAVHGENPGVREKHP